MDLEERGRQMVVGLYRNLFSIKNFKLKHTLEQRVVNGWNTLYLHKNKGVSFIFLPNKL